MSVGEEQNECPLCMEPLELDDINFFPCTCGYQICRFCWHRIRTDENGLCPACRKQYPEDPAEFKPLTEDELQRIKKERRQKDLQRKQKAAENRKHLANVRVVQKNLVFVVGLSQRLADPEVLKKPEYFGKFGKIHKVVINHSTSYAGAQVRKSEGPSASAYVTYVRPEDALRAIQAVNNIYVDGRNLKASLGTTKYCSHFLRGAQCPKPDCMYLHELGEEAASFTKEEMQQGKHQEYEQKLYEQFMNNQNLNHQQQQIPQQPKTPPVPTPTQPTNRKKTGSPQTIQSGSTPPSHVPPSTSKDAWPTLAGGHKPERLTNGTRSSKHAGSGDSNRAPGHHRNKHHNTDTEHSKSKGGSSMLAGRGSGGTTPDSSTESPQSSPPPMSGGSPSPSQSPVTSVTSTQIHNTTQHPLLTLARKPTFDPTPDNPMSLFCNNGFPASRQPKPHLTHSHEENSSVLHTEIPDTIPVASSTDWQAAFGFTSSTAHSTHQHNSASSETHDDDLGFDPWDESTKALADLIEKEQQTDQDGMMGKNLPPGFSPNHIGAYMGSVLAMLSSTWPSSAPSATACSSSTSSVEGIGHTGQPPLTASAAGASKMMGLMQFPPPPGGAAAGGLPSMPSFHAPPPPLHGHYHDLLADFSLADKVHGRANHQQQQPQSDLFSMKDWQDGLRALLPNINISFGGPPTSSMQQTSSHATSHSAPNISKNHTMAEEPPHWMASLQHLTDDTSHNSRLPFLQQLPFRGGWAPSTQHPPPGFLPASAGLRPPTQMTTEAHNLATEGL